MDEQLAQWGRPIILRSHKAQFTKKETHTWNLTNTKAEEPHTGELGTFHCEVCHLRRLRDPP